ncbi:MAG: hypothetical protein ABSC53_03750 [Bacteroidota bacterium]
MRPDEKILGQFKKTYQEEFSEKISIQEAFERFSRLVNALRIICLSERFSSLDRPGGYDTVRTLK